MGVPPTGKPSGERSLTWLRSQIVGRDAKFDSPFGRRRLTYADHTASGRCLQYIEDFVADNVLPFYGNTHTTDSYVGRRMSKMVDEARGYVKRCLGGGPNDVLLFCGTGCTGAVKRLQEVMGVAVPSTLRDKIVDILPREERWVVFVGPYEHHSNLLSWRQSSAEVIEIGQDCKGSIDMDELRRKLRHYRNANRPILGSFSACSNVTGKITDTRALAKLLHEFEGFACFDFAASGPYAKIDMRTGEIDGYDAIFLSPHKFLGGPGSPGILLASKALYCLGSSPPSTCSGGTVTYVNGFNEKDTLYLEEIEGRENGGTPPIIQITRLALAFWVKDNVGQEVIEKTEHQYIEEAIKRLLKNSNIEILGNIVDSRLAILSFVIYSTTDTMKSRVRDKPLHCRFVASLLNDLFGVQARAGCSCAAPYGNALLGIDKTQSLLIRSTVVKGYQGVKPGWTRISFPYYMSEEEFHFVLEALEFVADYGQIFLPLYGFDIRTGGWTIRRKALAELLSKEKKGSTRTSPPRGPVGSDDTSIPRNDSIAKTPRDEYKSYFEQAWRVAGLLQEFPLQRTPGEEDMGLVDEHLVYFRI